jgi:hypothetical protein
MENSATASLESQMSASHALLWPLPKATKKFRTPLAFFVSKLVLKQEPKIRRSSTSVQADLMRFGDAISMQGPLKVEAYAASDGSTKVSLSLVADALLALCQPSKPRKLGKKAAMATMMTKGRESSTMMRYGFERCWWRK